ncbi:DNA primase large subunit [Fistulifera solaris]|uniref:DNA primase large subunit n=1 Tax=Fistulifera solaris TaxID=1519565 RepID=A0A1Z5JX80_FISSO|nr:DNA primase large subunit [Fistulifera solaris]|eukprot:GAX18509.1 DNA primase large subunit [Fistulifera solaris]
MNVIGLIPKSNKNAESNLPSLNWYDTTPNYELSLDQFEVYALKRLKVLRKIEQIKMMKVTPDIIRQKLDQIIKQEDLTDHDMDEASHFILRLSYCQTEELRRWFLQQEAALFRHRLQALTEQQLAHAVRKYAQLQPIAAAEKEKYRDALLQFTTPVEFQTAQFYAVPFTQALSLLATRQCFLRAGSAYVPQSKVLTILEAKFRTDLARFLALLANAGSFQAAQDAEASRIFPLLKNMHRALVQPREQQMHLPEGQVLTADNVEQFTSSMPLCMRQIHAGLKADHHLKYQARLQYGFFLRGAQLSLEDALLFFQRHFQKVTNEKFQKEYAYNIRHMYGKEGGTKDGRKEGQLGYGCSKIIGGLVAPSSANEHHGCPFKHYDEQNLHRLLQKLNIGDEKDRREILQQKKMQQYQLACLKHFEVTHPNAFSSDVPMDNVGNHPNAWFQASVAYQSKFQSTSNPSQPPKAVSP